MAQVKQVGYCSDTALKRFREAVLDREPGKTLGRNGRNFEKGLHALTRARGLFGL